MASRPSGPRALLRQARRSRWFGLGLLAYLVLTVAVFVLVFRYARIVAAFYGHDIENAWLQYGLYFGLFLAATYVAQVAAARLPLPLRRENSLRLAFIGGLTLSLVIAIYQSRFGWYKGINYFAIGSLGAFVASMEYTRRFFGLVEVISEPSRDTVLAVERGHRGLKLATGHWDRWKRLIELLLSLVLMVVSLPISIPLTMLLLLQDPGPMLVAKVAVMQGGRSFRQLKLRTMVKDAEARTGPVPAAPEDARITWLGRVLRRTHIDELPQMINIGLGHMSLVGPRPERTVFVLRHLQEIPHYRERHRVRPGLAGMAQVYGDYYSTPRQKLRYDLLYIRRRGPSLDLKLFGTAVMMALFGMRPGRGRHQRDRFLEDYREERWRKAYQALRGESAPSETQEAGDTPQAAAGDDDGR